MAMIRRFLARLAARRLANRGADKRHAMMLAKARQMRRELGMPESPALGS